MKKTKLYVKNSLNYPRYKMWKHKKKKQKETIDEYIKVLRFGEEKRADDLGLIYIN